MFSREDEGDDNFLKRIFLDVSNKMNSAWQSSVDHASLKGNSFGKIYEMETLSTLLIGWLVFGAITVILAHLIFKYAKLRTKPESKLNHNHSENGPGSFSFSDKTTQQIHATIVPTELPEPKAPPTATGCDSDSVQWVNSLFKWLYQTSDGGCILSQAWNERLNDYTFSTALETGVLIEVLEFLPQSPAPSLTNIVVDCSSTDDMAITCNIFLTLYMRIQTTRTQREITKESEYACAVNSLNGKLIINIKTHQCFASVKFDGYPEISLEIEGIKNNSTGLDEKQLKEVIKEEICSALQKSSLELDFYSCKAFPKFCRKRSTPNPVVPVGYDALVSSHSPQPVGIVGLNGKRLLVKVVQATEVGCEEDVASCYVVVEMDEPPQKFLTGEVKNTSSPFWDEQFLFDLSDNTLELLFEVYDKADNRFLGLGIVGIEELIATPSQRQVIPLQARPCESDVVSGSLTCEFLFLDRAELPDLTLRRAAGTYSLNENGKQTTLSYMKNDTDFNDLDDDRSSSPSKIVEAAVRDLEERQTSSFPSLNTKSTVIIHSSKKEKEENVLDGDFKPNVNKYRNDVGHSEISLGKSSFTARQNQIQSKDKLHTANPSNIPIDEHFFLTEENRLPSVSNGAATSSDERGRGRDRSKRSFFGTLKRKFSRSKSRSKSVDPIGVEHRSRKSVSIERDPLAGRSASMERYKQPLAKGSKTNNELQPGLIIDDFCSRRSSMSGTSGFSDTTYISESSLMVVESFENGVIRHYLIPVSLQRKKKWRKKGTKLHVYNEHIFVSKHLSSSSICQVCQKSLGLRIGKQGYECRDCSMKCHKECHVKADFICPNSSVNTMNLVIVRDEKNEKQRRRGIS